MSKPTNFRRSKLVKFVAEQERLIRETVEQLEQQGVDSATYEEPRKAILERLKAEFDISADELAL
jgi:FKBP-type peptidyl-prolyl cis-trans isomerase (trigger factor)